VTISSLSGTVRCCHLRVLTFAFVYKLRMWAAEAVK
jgi:hypothetical protein